MSDESLIPGDLAAHIRRYWRLDGERWLATLPSEVEDALRRWDLKLVSVFLNASTAFVARVLRADHTPAVLKISYPELHGEAAALLAYGDSLAVSVYEYARNAILLEEVWPGRSLREVGTADEISTVTRALARELWKVTPFEGVVTLVDQCDRYRAIDQETLRTLSPEFATEIASAIDLLVELANDTPRKVLLHGDLHPGNILSARRAPWLVTDPTPLLGDPAYDLVPLVREGFGQDLTIPSRVDLIQSILGAAEEMEVSPWRIAAWGTARRADWSCLCMRANDPTGASLAREEMRRFREAMAELGDEPV